MPVAECRMWVGTRIMEFQIVCVPGSLVAKLARKAAGEQLGLKEKCRIPAMQPQSGADITWSWSARSDQDG